MEAKEVKYNGIVIGYTTDGGKTIVFEETDEVKDFLKNFEKGKTIYISSRALGTVDDDMIVTRDEPFEFCIDTFPRSKKNDMENKLEKAYKEYEEFLDSGVIEDPNYLYWDLSDPKHTQTRKFTIEEFEFRILTHTKFRKKFGKDCIRGLSVEERRKLFLEIHPTWPAVPTHQFFDEQNIPKYVII